MNPTQYWHHDPCVWCGRKVRKMSREHIVPRGLGGAEGSENQAMACSYCNRMRGSTPLLLWLRALRAANGDARRASRSAARERREFAASIGIRFVG